MSANNNEHGDTIAAWTGAIIVMIAFATGTLAFWFNQAALVWASAGLAAVGVATGLVLKKAGFGKSKH